MKTLNFLSKVFLLALAVTFFSCDDNDDDVKQPETIAEIAIATPSLSRLVLALDRAGLVETLNSPGSFTVFAPTDTAFNAFLQANGFNAVTDVPVPVLQQILLNHVVAGKFASTDLSTMYVNSLATYADTDLNLSMFIDTTDGVKINGVSSVVAPNIMATNGIIHVVDAVIGLPTVATFAVADPTLSTLETALTTLTPGTDFAGILSTSNGTDPAPFTVFAPTNAAFAQIATLPGESTLTEILKHHVIAGANVTSGDLTPNGDTTAPSLQGDNLTITLPGTGSNIANLTDGSGNSDLGIIKVDVQAANGVIHVINKVAIPNLP